jgi:AraC-like DNA-binding protein
MDSLSEVMGLLDVQVAAPCRLEVSGQWALSFSEYRHIRVGAVLAGEMWLTPAHLPPIRLTDGDCYLMTSGLPYVVGSNPDRVPDDGTAVFEAVWPDTVHHNMEAGQAADTSAISGALTFDDTTAILLLDHLPSVAAIHADSGEARALRPVLELLANETSLDLPGTGAMRDHLTHVLFLQTLRVILARPTAESLGWLHALADDRLRSALALIHRTPAQPWTVAELAASAQMSRSAFALRFKNTVGLSPLEYVTYWRIQMAARALRSTDHTVSAVAGQFGYGSESAFIRAFKRVKGSSPARYRTERSAGSAIRFPAGQSEK